MIFNKKRKKNNKQNHTLIQDCLYIKSHTALMVPLFHQKVYQCNAGYQTVTKVSGLQIRKVTIRFKSHKLMIDIQRISTDIIEDPITPKYLIRDVKQHISQAYLS